MHIAHTGKVIVSIVGTTLAGSKNFGVGPDDGDGGCGDWGARGGGRGGRGSRRDGFSERFLLSEDDS